MNRRKLLIAGSASIVILGVAGRQALHSNLKTAQKPWRDADLTLDDPRMAALSYAILAPNPHNRQPWLVELRGDSGLTLYCDTDRMLPETDPFNRQIVVGLGAFLELLEMAAGQNGYGLKMNLFPEGQPEPNLDNRPIAHIEFTQGARMPKDPLFAHVLDRRTTRVPFDTTREVSPEDLAALKEVLRPGDPIFGYTTNAKIMDELRDINREGWEVEVHTKRAHAESTRLTRIGEKEINEQPDGISLSGPLFEGLKLAGVMNREAMDDPNSRMFEETIKFYNGLIETAKAFAWVGTMDNTRINQIEAGRNWVRVQLAATGLGLSFQPLSQLLQEFPEMADLYTKFHDMLEFETPARVQGFFRLGYAKDMPPAPRWPLETRLINA